MSGQSSMNSSFGMNNSNSGSGNGNGVMNSQSTTPGGGGGFALGNNKKVANNQANAAGDDLFSANPGRTFYRAKRNN
jgi:hypothetical protein